MDIINNSDDLSILVIKKQIVLFVFYIVFIGIIQL